MEEASPTKGWEEAHLRCRKCGTRIWKGFQDCGEEHSRRWTAEISPTQEIHVAQTPRPATTPVTSETEDAGYETEQSRVEDIDFSEQGVVTVSSEGIHMDLLEKFHWEESVKASLEELDPK